MVTYYYSNKPGVENIRLFMEEKLRIFKPYFNSEGLNFLLVMFLSYLLYIHHVTNEFSLGLR